MKYFDQLNTEEKEILAQEILNKKLLLIVV
jgi:hypothetical protein